MTNLLKASLVVDQEVQNLIKRCEALKTKGVVPSLKVVLVGNNPASLTYTRNKKKFCERFGAECEILHFPEGLSEKEFLKIVNGLAYDPSIHGCFVQLPLPAQLKHLDIGKLIPANKDVDGFHESNLCGLMAGDRGEKFLLPCTPKGIITLLHHYQINPSGKKVAIIGRSLIVGKPLALLMANYDATVTICHSKTKDIREITKNCEIIISAIGKAKFIDSSYLNDSGQQVIVDVGTNYDSNNKLCGDVNFDDVIEKVAAISPVPGGVGPMTILSLGQNLLQAAEAPWI
ncbi:MAG: bifunctional 5,10-methylenetetrahydrofolate dehydrogenase/5,10-methenyltetrahydrofolate cyclohydrolase [Pseudomonadota bacterium]